MPCTSVGNGTAHAEYVPGVSASNVLLPPLTRIAHCDAPCPAPASRIWRSRALVAAITPVTAGILATATGAGGFAVGAQAQRERAADVGVLGDDRQIAGPEPGDREVALVVGGGVLGPARERTELLRLAGRARAEDLTPGVHRRARDRLAVRDHGAGDRPALAHGDRAGVDGLGALDRDLDRA